MSGRSASAGLFLAILVLAASPAEAKTWNFTTGSPIGIGLHAGLSQNPDSDLVGTPQKTSTSFSHFFGFEPFLDFGNVILRVSAQLHSLPVLTGSGTDSRGSYSETSDVGAFVYGAQLLLAPYISENQSARAFIKLGLARAIARGENVRTYSGGNPQFSEKFDGATREMSVGGGFEFFIVQNYSMTIEGGFRQLEFGKLENRGGTDLEGNLKNKGDSLVNSSGANKKLNYSGIYGGLGFNLHF